MAPLYPPPPPTLPPGNPNPWLIIAMLRLNTVKYNEEDTTVEVGAGCLWREVYNSLKRYGRNVVGGSATLGVGVAGFLVGGGYSPMKTNQFGLGIDNIAGYEIVLPDGSIKNPRATDSDPKLFNALRVSSWRYPCFYRTHCLGREVAVISAS